MNKDEVVKIVRLAGLHPDQDYVALEHEIVVDFAFGALPESTINKFLKLGIPREKMRIAIIIEADEEYGQ